MKRVLRIVAAALVAVTLVFPLASCTKEKLAVPTELTINYDYVSSWSTVDDAQRYEIKITETSTQTEKPLVSSKKASYDFSNLSAGTYKIVVRAIAGDNKHKDSEWSGPLEFTRDPETGCTYTLINNGAAYEITRCSTAVSGDVELEDVYRGKPVVSIADGAFKGSRAESIKVGKNVTYVGDNAFYGAVRLKKAVLPEGLKYLGEKAFQGCRVLEEVNIPESITELKESTFAYCTALSSAKLHDKITDLGYGVFQSCKALTEIVIPDSVTAIGDYCFNLNDKLASVKIGSGVTSIGEYAFYGCSSLTNIEFAEKSSLTTLGKGTFASTGFAAFTVPQGVTDIGENCFDSAASLAAVSIPDSVTHVGSNAFYRTKLYDDAIDYETNKPKDASKDEVFLYADKWLIAYANGVQKKDDKGKVTGGLTKLDDTNLRPETVGIADYTFVRTSTLKYITATDNLKYIGKYAFAACDLLSRATIPYAVEIGDYAFYKCTILNKADFTYTIDGKSNLKKIGSYAFYGCTDMGAVNPAVNAKITVPSSVESIGPYAFNETAFWKNADKGVVYVGAWIVGFSTVENGRVDIKSGTVGIGDYAFLKCTSLVSVGGLDTDIKYIGRGAFSKCSSLAAVTLSSNVTEIKPYTFNMCEKLYSVSFSPFIESIGDHAFYGCTGLLAVDFSSCNKLKSIGDYAFYACSKISELNLGTKLETIGNYAFANRNPVVRVNGLPMNVPERMNQFLTEIVIPDSVTDIGENAFAFYNMVTSVKLGANVKNIGAYAFKHCTALKEITLPDGITSVGKSVFYKDSAVTKVNFGKDIDEIGDYAFFGMENVERLILPQGVKSIGKYAFLRWKAVKSVVLSKDVETIGDHAFNACNSATFYTDAQSIMPKWSKNWNSSYRPVVWNCTLSEDKTYVVSVTIGENGISNPLAKGGISAPVRDGYTFVGWTTREGSSEVEFSADNLGKVEKGVTVYAMWQKAV